MGIQYLHIVVRYLKFNLCRTEEQMGERTNNFHLMISFLVFFSLLAVLFYTNLLKGKVIITGDKFIFNKKKCY